MGKKSITGFLISLVFVGAELMFADGREAKTYTEKIGIEMVRIPGGINEI